MSQDVAARLGALAQDHREGRLTLSAYRSLRAPLLDMLVTPAPAGGADTTVTDPSTTTRPRHRLPQVGAASAAQVGLATPAESLVEASALVQTNLAQTNLAQTSLQARTI
jgi:hypothetical protein